MELPPQVMKDQVRSLAARHDAEQIERGLQAQDSGRWPYARGGQSLPVLQAFHEFLEIERRRTRARMLVLSAIFVMLLLCILGAGVLAALYFSKSVDGEMSALQTQLQEVRKQSGALHADAQARLASLSGEAAQLHKQVLGTQAAVDAVRREMAVGVTGQADQLSELRKLLASVADQNSALASGLDSLGARLMSITAAPPAVVRAPPEGEPEPASPPLPDLEPLPPGERWIQVDVTPPGAAEKIPLMLSIPE